MGLQVDRRVSPETVSAWRVVTVSGVSKVFSVLMSGPLTTIICSLPGETSHFQVDLDFGRGVRVRLTINSATSLARASSVAATSSTRTPEYGAALKGVAVPVHVQGGIPAVLAVQLERVKNRLQDQPIGLGAGSARSCSRSARYSPS